MLDAVLCGGGGFYRFFGTSEKLLQRIKDAQTKVPAGSGADAATRKCCSAPCPRQPFAQSGARLPQRQVTPQFALRYAPIPDIYCFDSFSTLVRRSPSTRSRCRRSNSLPFAQMDSIDRAASRQQMLLNHLRPVSIARDVVSVHDHASQCNCPGAELRFATDTGDGPGSGGCLPAAGAPQSIACMIPQCRKVRADCCPARSSTSLVCHQST